MIKRMTDRELARFFANKKIATMQELKHALVTEVDMTVYRALKRLSYRTSYSAVYRDKRQIDVTVAVTMH